MRKPLATDDRGIDVLLCACCSLQHVIAVSVDAEKEQLSIGVMLNSYLPFWKRAWLGLKYIFGFSVTAYGHYDEFLFDARDLGKLEAAIREIQVERVFTTEEEA